MPRFSLNLELFTSDWFNTHRSEDLPEVVTVAHLNFLNDSQKLENMKLGESIKIYIEF